MKIIFYEFSAWKKYDKTGILLNIKYGIKYGKTIGKIGNFFNIVYPNTMNDQRLSSS